MKILQPLNTWMLLTTNNRNLSAGLSQLHPTLPNGHPCFSGEHCGSGNCSSCALPLRCGQPIGSTCITNEVCCSLNCIEGMCQVQGGKTIFM